MTETVFNILFNFLEIIHYKFSTPHNYGDIPLFKNFTFFLTGEGGMTKKGSAIPDELDNFKEMFSINGKLRDCKSIY